MLDPIEHHARKLQAPRGQPPTLHHGAYSIRQSGQLSRFLSRLTTDIRPSRSIQGSTVHSLSLPYGLLLDPSIGVRDSSRPLASLEAVDKS